MVCDILFESSDRFFHYLGKLSVEEITLYGNMLLYRAFKIWWRDRRNHRPVFLAIDTTQLAYDGKVYEYALYAVKKRGLNYGRVKVVEFAAISIVSPGFRLTLAVVPVKRKEKLHTVVARLAEQIPDELRVRAVLVDKEYYQSHALRTLEDYGLKYVVPVVQYKDMTLSYHVAELTDVWRFKHTIRQGEEDCFTVNVYLEDQGIESYIAFASNLDMQGRDFFTLIKAYRNRWNQEIGFKDAKEFRIKTSTRNHGYRVLAYMISHLLMGLHCLAQKNNKVEVTLDQMKQILLLMLTLEHGTQRLTKRLTVAY